MQDRPTATEILDDVAALLGDEIVPALDGNLRHHARVAANLCRIVARELTMGPALDVAEIAALANAVGDEVGDGDALALHTALARTVRARPLDDLRGEWADDLRDLHATLSATVAGKLAVAKPGYDDADLPETERST